MNKVHQALVAFLLISVSIPGGPVYATTLQEEVQANLNATSHGNLQGTLQNVMKGDLQSDLQTYQKELGTLRDQVEEQNRQGSTALQQAQSLQVSINIVDQSIAKQKQSFGELAFNLVTYIRSILNLSQKIQSKTDLDFALQTQNNLIISLNKEKQQTIDTQSGLQKDIDDTKRFIDGQTKEKEWLLAQEKSDQAMGKIIIPTNLNGTVDQLLVFSKTFLGSSYVWGGSTPTPGFDCSGYVQYVYNHFGINLNRVTWDQYQEGQSVAEADLKPGDLAFFTTYAPGASHVGIYIGNRMMIDDSDYGVAYDSLDHPYWSAKYLGARRVIK